MKKIALTLTILSFFNIPIFAEWGPKIKLNLKNDADQTAKLFIGVDTFATNDWDKDIVFTYKDDTLDTTLTENIDLPPAPIGMMYCRLVKDSMQPTGSYSYVDFRNIPNTDTFFHKYWINIMWYSTAEPKIYIHWGKLPDGIDSAKLHCYEWMDDNYYVNMNENEGIELDNEAYKNCRIYVWYNKKHTDIVVRKKELNMILYPNPTNDYINIYNENYNFYYIVDFAGREIMNGKLDLQSNNKICISDINSGTYSIIMINNNGKNNKKSFIKN